MQMQEGRCGEYLRTPPEDQSGAMVIAHSHQTMASFAHSEMEI